MQKKQTLLPFNQKNWQERNNGYIIYPQKDSVVSNGVTTPNGFVSNGTIKNGSIHNNSFIYNTNSSSSNLLFV